MKRRTMIMRMMMTMLMMVMVHSKLDKLARLTVIYIRGKVVDRLKASAIYSKQTWKA